MLTLRTDLDAAVPRLLDAVDDALERAARSTVEGIAYSARAMHPWQNRTGTLEASIAGEAPTGKASEGTLQARAVASAPYGSFLERQPTWAFLEPAWRALEGQVEETFERALGGAAQAAGW